MKVELALRRSFWAAGLFVLVAACASSRVPHVSETGPGAEPPRPNWMDEGLSWDKLDSIEAWLGTSDALQNVELAREAELLLAEGRLAFSERDATSRFAPTTSLNLRLTSARKGFEKLLAYPDLTTTQRTRAEIGRRRALALLGASRPEQKGELHIVSRSEWGAAPSEPSRLTPISGSWTRITIHHSAEVVVDRCRRLVSRSRRGRCATSSATRCRSATRASATSATTI